MPLQASKPTDAIRDFIYAASIVIPLTLFFWSLAALLGMPWLFTWIPIVVTAFSALAYLAIYIKPMFYHLDGYIDQWVTPESTWKPPLTIGVRLLCVIAILYTGSSIGSSSMLGIAVSLSLLHADQAVLPIFIFSAILTFAIAAYFMQAAYLASDQERQQVIASWQLSLRQLGTPIRVIIDTLILYPWYWLTNRGLPNRLAFYNQSTTPDEHLTSTPNETEDDDQPQNNSNLALSAGQTMSWISTFLLAAVVFSITYTIVGLGIFAALLAALIVLAISAIAVRHNVDRLIRSLFNPQHNIYTHVIGKKRNWQHQGVFILCFVISCTINGSLLEARPLVVNLLSGTPLWLATFTLLIGLVLLTCMILTIRRRNDLWHSRGLYGLLITFGILFTCYGIGSLIQEAWIYWCLTCLATFTIVTIEGLYLVNAYFAGHLLTTAESSETTGHEAATPPPSKPTTALNNAAFTATFFLFLGVLYHYLAPNTLADISGQESDLSQHTAHDHAWVYGTFIWLGILVGIMFFVIMRGALHDLPENMSAINPRLTDNPDSLPDSSEGIAMVTVQSPLSTTSANAPS